jgi:hypothetical protein
MMKILLSNIAFLLLSTILYCQSPGDTIIVKTFNYSQTYGINQWSPGIRDTMIDFPNDSNLSFEKIILKYNMRCKDGLVSPPISGQTDIGCGEWDINCHTYLYDSTRVDSIFSTHPSHYISNFSDIVFPYNSNPHYNYYQYNQQDNSPTAINSEDIFNLGAADQSVSPALPAEEHSAKSVYLYTAQELIDAGFQAGEIDGLRMTANANSQLQFLRISLKLTSDTEITPGNYSNTGFERVYFKNTSIQNGDNSFYFDDPFTWDGSSNLLIEFSFTNTEKSSPLSFEGSETEQTNALHGVNGYYINTSATGVLDLPGEGLSTISNEITISFWARGDEGVSTVNTSILEAGDASNLRQVNIHLPWSNSQIYWDCGNDGSGYDRINKAASANELQKVWNHWSFVKNAGTGEMKIYLNGTLWHSGSGKTKPIDIKTFILGSSRGFSNFYRGDIDELRIWNKELSQEEISEWMHRSLDPSHPKYGNLVAYYPLSEGEGNAVMDHSTFAQSADFVNPPQWNFTRGNELNRIFKLPAERPQIQILSGDYTFSNMPETVLDSLVIPPHIVNTYEIVTNYGTIENDIANIIKTEYLWLASEYYLFDGETGDVLDAFDIEEEDLIGIYDLPFIQRYPAKIQLMSFVTPYGINLDLGPEGKTWTFDVSDFEPILKGNKRMTVEAGGQWMEDMDIQFLFIVGTPPRKVLNYQNIWRVQSRGYAQILSNQFFPPVEFKLDPTASQYKIRSVISGHGQEGEFIPRNHYINIDGAAEEFIWEVWMECAENPVYPQGGTWIYDRAGWCPGFPTMVSEFELEDLANPGEEIKIDYGMYTAAGSSNYWVSNALVSYDEPSFDLDASVIDVIAPTDKVEYSRLNAVCANPIVTIQNTGKNELESLLIEYWINDGEKASFTWEGSLDFLEKEDINLPSPKSLWMSASSSDNTFHVSISQANGASDEYALNNLYNTKFDMPDLLPDEIVVWFKTNNAAFESRYDLYDDAGNKIFSRSGMSNNTNYRDTFDLSGVCHSLVIKDSGDDGIDFWANNDGLGFVRVTTLDGEILHYVEGDFGDSYIYNFSVDPTVGIKEQVTEHKGLKLYPNPATNRLIVEGPFEMRYYKVFNQFGSNVSCPVSASSEGVELNTSALIPGIYYLQYDSGQEKYGYKFVIQRD